MSDTLQEPIGSDRVHAQHHAALPKLGRGVLRWCHREFAGEHGLGWLLDREYDEGSGEI